MRTIPQRSNAALLLGVALLAATGCSSEPVRPAAPQAAAPAADSSGTGAPLLPPPKAAPVAPQGATGAPAGTGGGASAGAAGSSPAAAMPGAPAAKPGGAQVFAAQAEAEPQRAPVAPGKVTAPAVATSEPGSGSGSSGFAAPAKPREPAMAEPAAADVSAQAQPLYKDNCLACHGDQLQGNVGPSLSKVGGRKSKAQLVEQIREGSSDMPGFKETLSEEEVETLAAWLTVKK